MKRIILILIAACCLFGKAYAADDSRSALMFAKEYENTIVAESEPVVSAAQTSETKNPKQVWELGTEIYCYDYREPDVMREDGIMYGLAGSYTYHNNFMVKGEARGSWGQVDYKNSGTINNINDYSFELRGLGGHDFAVSDKLTLTPFFGLGYRYLNDDTSGKTSSTGAAGYERESNYIYSPIGFEGTAAFKDGWFLGASIEYDIFWWGRQISHLSDVDSGFGDVKNDQKRGYGIRGALKIQKNWDKLNLVFEPFVRYWNIAKSEDSNVTYSGTIVGYGYEPKNNTTEYGIKIGVSF